MSRIKQDRSKSNAEKTPTPVSAMSNESPLISNARLKQIYIAMLQCRMLEEAGRSTFSRTGKPHEYELAIGREAALVSTAMQLTVGDLVGSAQIDFVRHLVEGTPVQKILKLMREHDGQTESGFAEKLQRTMDAVKRKKAKKSKKPSSIALAYADDSATEQECWHDAMRAAHRLELPVMFVWQSDRYHANSAWSGNHSRSPQYGFPIMTVDGNDAVAVYRVAQEAAHRARGGHGPTLIECRTYRWSRNTETGEAAFLEARDPILKMQRHLESKRLFGMPWSKGLEQEFRLQLDAALAEYSRHPATPLPPEAERGHGFAIAAGLK